MYIYSDALADGSWADGEGVDILECSFKNNTSGFDGGAVFYDGSYGLNNEQMIVRGSVFFGNNGSSGGAFRTRGVVSISVYESTFERNTAFFGRGGGIYTYGQ